LESKLFGKLRFPCPRLTWRNVQALNDSANASSKLGYAQLRLMPTMVLGDIKLLGNEKYE